MRLSDTQVSLGEERAILSVRALQVNEERRLPEIGKLRISYSPGFQKLLIHRVAIYRGGQILDQTHKVKVVPLLIDQVSNRDDSGALEKLLAFAGEVSRELLVEDVHVGDTVYLAYTVQGGIPMLADYWAEDFAWDNLMPVDYQRIVVTRPKTKPLYWRQIGGLGSEALTPRIELTGLQERLIFEGRSMGSVVSPPTAPPDYYPGRVLEFRYGAGSQAAFGKAWIQDARPASQGDEVAQLQYAEYLQFARGAANDVERAIRIYARLAKAGNARAKHLLGYAMMLGSGVKEDATTGLRLLNESIAAGDLRAAEQLGVMYYEGDLVPQDLAQARKLLELASTEQSYAAYILGKMYRQGTGVEKNLGRSAALFRLAADAGNEEAQVMVAADHYRGVGVDIDMKLAARYYQLAADQYNSIAMNNLGDMYENGFGVEKDFGRALELYKRAAKQGAPFAFASLGSLFYEGRGVAKDLGMAYTYLALALKNWPEDMANKASRRDMMASKLDAAERSRADAIVAKWREGDPLPGLSEASASPAGQE